jgi:hypothetical protein
VTAALHVREELATVGLSAVETSARVETLERTWLRLVVRLLFTIAFTVALIRGWRHARDEFTAPHAFVSADVATTARTYMKQGVFRLRGVPVNNNSPVSNIDFYTHWPPLLPLFLSAVFRVFGPGEFATHLLMLAIYSATVWVIYALGRYWLNEIGGCLAAFFWITMPVEMQFSYLACQQALAMLFVLAALLAFEKSRNAGAALLLLAVASSWEAALVAPAMWLVSKFNAKRSGSAAAALFGTGSAIVAIILLYSIGNPQAAADTLQAAKFYAGFSHTYSSLGTSITQNQLPVLDQFKLTLLNNVFMLGPLGLAAFFQVSAARPRQLFDRLLPLAAPWILWCIIMHNHTARHHFEFVIAAPAVAICLAWVAIDEIDPKRIPVRVLSFVGLALLQTALIPAPAISDGYDPEKLIAYGREIREHTPEDSVVLSPAVSAVPLFYSDRHIVRSVSTPESALEAVPRIQQLFPRAPIYLAIPPELQPQFASPLLKPAASGSAAIIFKLK